MKITSRPFLFILTLTSTAVILLLSCHPSGSPADADDKDDHKNKHDKIKLEKLGELPKDIPEASGLVMLDSTHFLTHNDSRGEPVLFVIDNEGNITRRITLENESNFDWEEITTDYNGNYFVGDFGNNEGKRREFFIYKFPDPSKIHSDTLDAGDIRFTLPDNNVIPAKMKNMNFDFEAMVHFGNSLYLFSKNRTEPYNGYCKLYKLPDMPGEYVATLIDSLYFGDGPVKQSSITGATLSKDQTELVLISHERIWRIFNWHGDDFFNGMHTSFEFKKSDLSMEGICFGNNDDLYLTEERSAPGTGVLFKMNLQDISGLEQIK